jgi:segregation and condensation protein B
MSEDRFQQIRLLEALLFAASEPLGEKDLERHFPEGTELPVLLDELRGLYEARGVTLQRVGEKWAFRTATDLAPRMRIENESRRKLSRAAVETLAVIAYHQPVTRGEMEEIRGVALSKGTLDTLLEAGWIKPRGRRRTPGKPVTWGTTESFLDQFGLDSLDALPGVEELKAAGLLDARPAITALGARGELPPAGPAPDAERDEEDEDEFEEGLAPDEILAAEYGRELPADNDDEDTEDTEEAAGAPDGSGEDGTDGEDEGEEGLEDDGRAG